MAPRRVRRVDCGRLWRPARVVASTRTTHVPSGRPIPRHPARPARASQPEKAGAGEVASQMGRPQSPAFTSAVTAAGALPGPDMQRVRAGDAHGYPTQWQTAGNQPGRSTAELIQFITAMGGGPRARPATHCGGATHGRRACWRPPGPGAAGKIGACRPKRAAHQLASIPRPRRPISWAGPGTQPATAPTRRCGKPGGLRQNSPGAQPIPASGANAATTNPEIQPDREGMVIATNRPTPPLVKTETAPDYVRSPGRWWR
jgi:hypothetical protein